MNEPELLSINAILAALMARHALGSQQPVMEADEVFRVAEQLIRAGASRRQDGFDQEAAIRHLVTVYIVAKDLVALPEPADRREDFTL